MQRHFLSHPMYADSPLPATDLPWYRELARRMICLWPLKAVGTAAFITLFFQAYFYLLRNPGDEVLTMPLTPLDHWVGFSPLAFPIYASLWVYVSLPPALIGNFRGLLRYGVWIALLCLFCLALFWVFPTKVPDFKVDWSAHPSLAFLKGMDGAGNAFPSLHVASAVFSAIWLQRLLQAMRAPRGWMLANAVSCVAIAWSTLATLQHVALDALAGAAVGALLAWLSLRRPGRSLEAPVR